MTDGLIKVRPKNDLTGKTFGKLTVLRQGPDYLASSGKGRRRAQWYCKCSCGNPVELLILGDSIANGHTTSCGCAHRDVSSDNNLYDLSGEFGVCTMADGNKFIFDKEDYDLIRQYTWHISSREYIGTTIIQKINGRRKRDTLMLHRLIMGIQDKSWKDCVVDHIDGNACDNRKCNLRVVTQSQNTMNQKMVKNNTSGVPGVSYYKKRKKWGVRIEANNKKMFIGLFDTFEDAVKARKEAEEKYFGEFSYDNSRGVKKGAD